jgi:hypothetical protein
MAFAGAQTIAGTGEILFNGGGDDLVSASGTLNIALGVTLRGSNAQFTGAPIVNNGTMTADGSVPNEDYFRQFTIAPSSFTNNGTLKAINGGALLIGAGGSAAPWSNHGTIIENNSSIAFNGSFGTSDIANLQRTGGTVAINGFMNNTGQTLALNSTTGIYSLGGTITGGTITASGSGYLQVGNGTLDGVTIGGGAPSTVVVSGGSLSAPNGIAFAGGNIQVGSPFSTSSITLGGPLSGTGSLSLSGSTQIGLNSGVTLSLAPGIRLATSGSALSDIIEEVVGSASNNVNNQGVISAQTIGNLLYVVGNNVTNSGTMQAINGGYLTITGALTNTGTLIENNASPNLAISNFSPAIMPTIQRTGGAVNLAAAYNNAGGDLTLTSATGSLGLIDGGQITGGTVTTTGGTKLYIAASATDVQPSGTLSGVTIAGSLVVQEQGTLNVAGNLNLQNSTVTLGTSLFPVTTAGGAGTLITFVGNSHLEGTGQVLFESTFAGDNITPSINASLTIDSGVTIRTDTGGGYIGGQILSPYSGPIINAGLISAQTSGKTIIITGNSVTNQGT